MAKLFDIVSRACSYSRMFSRPQDHPCSKDSQQDIRHTLAKTTPVFHRNFIFVGCSIPQEEVSGTTSRTEKGIMWRLLGPQTPELVTQVYKDRGMQRRLHIDVEYDYGGTVTDLCTMDA
ncbi:hypothetical protein DY000_02024351 [Brassica cretica]|uniref:Uncharacterized protein n=1 Tax=Brassica cretica TaxID=69181 RepID=A0ABQ7E6G1_BRACR|nr:hypothetical protein DY000_02024351 [Brassica cretica]